METIFLTCAIVGGGVMAGQFLLSLLGLGHHDAGGGHDFHDAGGHDVGGHEVGGHDAGGHGVAGHDAHGGDHPHQGAHPSAGSRFFSLLTFRTVVAAVTFFGLAGMSAHKSELDPTTTLVIAFASGAGALVIVGYLMKALHRLKDDGTVRMERAVGTTGTVYLRVPGGKSGAGKVHLNVQNRTVECQAVTAGADALPTGAKVVVVAVLTNDTVEVAPATAV
jgi:hypothetical protein